MKQRAVIFLGGHYRADAEAGFYASLAAGAYVIGVDGSLAVLQRLRIQPQVIIGDFDSTSPALRQVFAACEQIELDSDKDMTDGEAAVDLAVARGATEVVFTGCLDARGETDQMLGNLMLLQKIDLPAMCCEPGQTVRLIRDETVTLDGAVGDGVSLLPLGTLVRLTYVGMKYPLTDFPVIPGSTRALRNELIAPQARITAVGSVLLLHYTRH